MKKLEDYEWICPEPFTNIYSSTTGLYKPCCVSLGRNLEKYVSRKMTTGNSSPIEFYNSEAMKLLRKSFKENDRQILDDVCSVCKNQEDANIRSHRQWYVDRFNDEFKHRKEELEAIIENDSEPTFFHSMEFDALGGNLCNLSCLMCDGLSSSRYLVEAIRLGEADKTKALIKLTPHQTVWDDLPVILSKLDELKLVGGEPLMSKETYRLLNMVPDPSKVILRIITNATVDPTKFIEIAKKFKSVTVNISIEGVDKVNEYIRYPSNWNNILNNAKKFTSMDNSNVIFVSTINALNIGRLYEIEEVAPSLIADGVVHEYTMSSIVNNNFYSLRSIPPEIKEKHLENLYQIAHKYAEVKKLIRYLETTGYNEDDMKKLMTHVKKRDKLRGTCLLDYFPEWETIYNEIEV